MGIDVIVVEHLTTKGMVKDHSLATHIHDASWGEFVRQLNSKTTWYGSTLVQAPMFYPSSETCSSRGATKAELILTQRSYYCDTCGLEIDRDPDAAINLATQSGTAQARSVAGRARNGTTEAGDTAVAHPREASREPRPVLVVV